MQPFQDPVYAGSIGDKYGHSMCIVCGRENPFSLKLDFICENETVRMRFVPHKYLQGYNGILHGGIIAGLLGGAMTHCLFHHNIQAVTAELNIRYICPVSYTSEIDLSARIIAKRKKMYKLESCIISDNTVCVQGTATFMDRVSETADAV